MSHLTTCNLQLIASYLLCPGEVTMLPIDLLLKKLHIIRKILWTSFLWL